MKALRFGSVCSGIEAASVAWGPLGWEAAWFSEIEPFPCAVLAHHYPDVPNLGDMTKLPEMIASHKVEAPDLFCGGTPCQAFSVAGLRQSLADDRGNLSLTFVEIANAIDDVRRARGEPESIVFWENVPGVLSTKDNAFGCFLGALAGSDSALVPIDRWTDSGVVAGPKRTVAWRTLDAQYFGLAQRRRRVFVVASAREGFDPAAVLLEWEGLRRDTAPSRETRKVTPTISSSGTGVSRVGFNCEDEWFIPTQPISIHPHCIGRTPDAGPQGKEYLIDGSAYCMDSRGQPQAVAQPITFGAQMSVPQTDVDLVQTLQAKNPMAVAQPIGFDGYNNSVTGNIAKTLDVGQDHHHVPIAFHPTQDQYLAQPMVLMDQGGSVMNVEHDITGTLRRETHGHEPVVMQPIPLDLRNAGRDPEKHDEMNRQGVGVGDPGDPAHTVTSAFVHGVAFVDVGATLKGGSGERGYPDPSDGNGHNIVAQTVMQPVAFYDYLGSQGGGVEIGISPTLKKKDGVAVTQPVAQPVAVGTDCYNGSITGDVAATLSTGSGTGVAAGPTVMQSVLAPTLTASNDPSRSPQSSEVTAQVAAVFEAIAYDILGTPASEVAKKADVHTPLRARIPGQFENSTVTMAVQAMQVRRLTPVECERLQGFPDDYTNIPWRKQPESPDGPRYKALGNSWAVPVVRWIGNRIAKNLRFEPC